MASPIPRHPLVELSSLSDPTLARHPLAQKAIVDVTRALRRHLHASERWPRPFQVVGIAYCALAGDRALIADDQGTGKSPTALCRILLGGHVPAVVVCPAGVIHNWRKEAGLWIPGLPIWRLDREDRPVPPPGWRGIVVTTWDLMKCHSYALARLKPRIVVADEVQYLLNENTGRSSHFDVLVADVPHLLLLSGTPVKNRSRDLWRLLNLLDPHAWPELTLRAFRQLQKDDFDRGVQSRLHQRVKQYMLRRLKADALTDLSAKQYQMLRVAIPEAHLREYRKIEREFDEWVDEKVRGDLVNEGSELEGEEMEQEVARRSRATLAAASLTRVVRLRKLVGVLKAPLAAAWIAEAVRGGEPVVCFAHHQEVLGALARALDARRIRYGVIDGKTAKTRRFSRVNEFQEGKIDVLLCSASAKEGITLHRARHVLFAERFWTSADEDQAADRLHRIGQKRDVTVWIMLALHTIDERMDQVVGGKRRMTRRTVDAAGQLALPPPPV